MARPYSEIRTKLEARKSRMATLQANDAVNFKVNELTILTKDHPQVLAHPELYDERQELPLNEGLRDSLQADGQRVNITVAVYGSDKFLINGHQRYKAAMAISPEFVLKANLIPFDIDGIIVSRLIDNEFRANLTVYDKIKKVAALGALKTADGLLRFNGGRLAQLFGVTLDTIYRWMDVSEVLNLDIVGMKDALQNTLLSVNALAAFLAPEYRLPDGRLDREKIAKAFVDLKGQFKENKTANRMATARSVSEASGKVVKPKQSAIRKVLTFEETEPKVMIALMWVLGDISLDRLDEMAQDRGVDMSYIRRAIEQKKKVRQTKEKKQVDRRKRGKIEVEVEPEFPVMSAQ